MTYNYKLMFFRIAGAATLILPLLACETIQQQNTKKPAISDEVGDKKADANSLSMGALESIRKGDLANASLLANKALRSKPDNADLHFLNALIYQKMADEGDLAQRDYAETGYLLALNYSPNHPFASYFLGLIYLDNKRWGDAQEQFAKSVWIDSSQVASFLGLAVASYYVRDLPVALWAIKRGLEIDPVNPEFLRIGALVESASGDQTSARRLLDRYKLAQPNQQQQSAVEKRVNQWNTVYQQSPPVLLDISGMPSSGGQRTNVPLSSDTVIANDVLADWRVCEANKPPAYQSQDSTSPNPDMAPMKELPSVCKGMPLPNMVIIDATFLRVDETQTNSNGVNLLNSLAVTLSGNSTSNADPNTRDPSSISRSFGTPTSGILYSLNLFNAADSKIDVISRPTLVAVDRMPSQFFSGSNVTMILPATAVGMPASVSEKPVGISLAVTPTFINSESMMLATRVSRSSFEPGSAGENLIQTMQQSINTVSANMLIHYGQTLILSGLSERTRNSAQSGVPFLNKLPFVQYLFSNKTEIEFNQSIIILLTPRKAFTKAESSNAVSDRNSPSKPESKTQQLLRSVGFNYEDNLTATFRGLDRNQLYREFRDGDITSKDWRNGNYMQRLLSDFGKLLLF